MPGFWVKRNKHRLISKHQQTTVWRLYQCNAPSAHCAVLQREVQKRELCDWCRATLTDLRVPECYPEDVSETKLTQRADRSQSQSVFSSVNLAAHHRVIEQGRIFGNQQKPTLHDMIFQPLHDHHFNISFFFFFFPKTEIPFEWTLS